MVSSLYIVVLIFNFERYTWKHIGLDTMPVGVLPLSFALYITFDMLSLINIHVKICCAQNHHTRKKYYSSYSCKEITISLCNFVQIG